MPTYTRPIEADLLTPGLVGTLGYTVKSAAGSTLIARTTSGIAEDGAGNYWAVVANWDTAWSGWIVWDAGAGTLAREPFIGEDVIGAVVAEELAGAALTSGEVAGLLDARIPADFTAGLFAAPGVFSTGALVHSPSGGGGDPWATTLPGSYGSGTAGGILGGAFTESELATTIEAQAAIAIAATTAKLPTSPPAGYGGGLTTGQAADLATVLAGVATLKSLQKLAAVAATSTTTSVVGDSSLDATAGTYATSSAGSCWMVFTSGANQGQARPIASYGGSNRTFGFSQAWQYAPSSGDTFAVYARYK